MSCFVRGVRIVPIRALSGRKLYLSRKLTLLANSHMSPHGRSGAHPSPRPCASPLPGPLACKNSDTPGASRIPTP